MPIEQVDREEADILATMICGCADARQHAGDVKHLLAYAAAAEQRGREQERAKISAWLRSLDRESGDINRFLPTTLANWIDERMHEL